MDEAQAQVERPKKALEPFAKYAATLEGPNWLPDLCPLSVAPALPSFSTGISVGDCRRAAEALASIPDPQTSSLSEQVERLRTALESSTNALVHLHASYSPDHHSRDHCGCTWCYALTIIERGRAVHDEAAALAATPARAALASIPEAAQPQPYPCAKCGVSRTEAEGGTIFTVCGECWNGPCWICGKEKGQPPERCNGHYEMPRVPESAPAQHVTDTVHLDAEGNSPYIQRMVPVNEAESNITEGPRPHNKWPTVASKREALNIARARAEGKAEGKAEGYREGQLRMRERAIEAIPSPGNATWVTTNIEALEPEPLPEPPKEGQ